MIPIMQLPCFIRSVNLSSNFMIIVCFDDKHPIIVGDPGLPLGVGGEFLFRMVPHLKYLITTSQNLV